MTWTVDAEKPWKVHFDDGSYGMICIDCGEPVKVTLIHGECADLRRLLAEVDYPDDPSAWFRDMCAEVQERWPAFDMTGKRKPGGFDPPVKISKPERIDEPPQNRLFDLENIA